MPARRLTDQCSLSLDDADRLLAGHLEETIPSFESLRESRESVILDLDAAAF